MSQADIERMYDDKGLDACWKWAQGHPDRWKALKEWAAGKAEQFGKELRRDRKVVDQARDDLHELHDKIAEVRENREKNKKALAEAEERGDEDRIRQLKSRAREINAALEAALRQLGKIENRQKRAKVEAADDKQAKLAWIERKIIYRDKWEKAKKRQKDKGGGYKNAEWEDWMGAGLNANVSPFVKKVVAWGILDYDLVATSLARDYVPPGGSTTSFHLNGHAGDIAGPRMSEFQQAVFNLFKGNADMWELFGPINGDCLKYGAAIYLGEGTPLENLHDTHVHVAG